MSIERAIFIFAGSMVLLSLALTYYVSLHFVWLTVFVGVNLFQFGFTQFCPMAILLKKFGMKAERNI
ncbi:DUF2892 domain-containing protein [Shewanella sp. 202IG2-18]|uniref:YgaP family membrane protein n=1 Tax=Parashewanella hymeniacidonis TaxID=2807618 RepID=UPI00196062CB|nr:DUF2892 domain-containing protein [Parashewanella hymeniacidonis]MBM7072180.1 DUF2892 domain-containing protein [Parashewanella hymeniacidonis]